MYTLRCLIQMRTRPELYIKKETSFFISLKLIDKKMYFLAQLDYFKPTNLYLTTQKATNQTDVAGGLGGMYIDIYKHHVHEHVHVRTMVRDTPTSL